jgi:hypothetical protein
VAFDPRQYATAVLEYHDKPALLCRLVTFLVKIDVVPPIHPKRINDQRSAEEKSHLGPRHAGLQLLNHFLRDDIALLDIHLVRGNGRQQWHILAAGHQQHEQMMKASK